MNSIRRQMQAFLSDEGGPTATEYAVLLALIIVVCIAAITAVGSKASAAFDDAQSAM